MSITQFFTKKKRPLSNAKGPPKKRKKSCRSIPVYITSGEEEEIVFIEYQDANGLQELLDGLHELGCENDEDEERYIFPLEDFKNLLQKAAHPIFKDYKFELKPASVSSVPAGINFNMGNHEESQKPENFKSMRDQEKLRFILRKIWKFDDFRENQEEAILPFFRGEDVFLMLPTGGGKSLCYLIPMLARMGIGIVICPLISLMFDQVRDLQKRGVKAYFWNSTLTKEQLTILNTNLRNKKVEILYISPERFYSKSFREILPTLDVRTIACDECHCISAYGRSFRPAYFRLGQNLSEWLPPSVPILACTASAPETVQNDVVNILFSGRSRLPVRITKSVLRDNIHLQILHAPEITELKKEEKMGTKLEKVLRDLSSNGKNIIYATTVECCKEVEAIFKSRERRGNNWPHITESYYSKLPKKKKEKVQNDFVDGNTNVVAATSAFGMGIDVANVRTVIHTLNPNSVEEYYQNIGRAGRDGLPANAICVRNEEDDWWLHMAEISVASYDQVETFYNWLKVQSQAKLEMTGKDLNKAIFGGKAHDLNISRIKTYLKGAGAISIQKTHPYVMKRKLQCFARKLRPGSQRSVWNYIQRKCMMHTEYKLYAYKVSMETGIDEKKVQDAMRSLKTKKAIEYSKQRADTIWIRDRMIDISYLKDKIDADRKYKTEQVESMRKFLRLESGCRWKWLREYFGENVSTHWRCHNCDLCEKSGPGPKTKTEAMAS